MLQTTARQPLPHLSNYNYPLSVTLRVFSEGDRYGIDISPLGMHPQRFSVPLTKYDLASLTQQLQESLDEAIAYSSFDQWKLAQSKSALRSLAELGHFMYRQIFDDAALTFINQVMQEGQKASIEVVSEDFFLPWHLIYPLEVANETLSYSSFWGMKHVIANILIRSRNRGRAAPHTIQFDGLPIVALATYANLPAVRDKEIPHFEELHQGRRIFLVRLPKLNSNERETELGRYRDFWKDSFQIAHFACHAAYDRTRPNLSYIRVSDEFSITFQDMRINDVQVVGNPLVILNACETSNLNPLYTSNFATLFLDQGARAVVATEAQIPDQFAFEFTRYLYDGLLEGAEIGETLLSARRFFLDHNNNPSGLAYSLYGPHIIHLSSQQQFVAEVNLRI